MRGPQLALWILAPFCLLLGFYGNWIVLLALLCGLLRKFGMIEFKKEALRKYIFCQDFQMMGFMSCASIGGSTMQLMLYSPILLHGYLVAGKVVEEHLKPQNSIPLTSFWKLLAVPPITTLLNYGN